MSSALKITLILSLLLSAGSHAAGTVPRKTLAPFASEQALSSYLQQLQARQEALLLKQQKLQRATAQYSAQSMAAPPAPPAPMAAKTAPRHRQKLRNPSPMCRRRVWTKAVSSSCMASTW